MSHKFCGKGCKNFSFKKQKALIINKIKKAFAVRTGLEPATPCVTGRYSNQLNYRTVAFSGCKYTSLIQLHKQFLLKIW